MTKCIIIADDLVGANATCSLFKKSGLKSATIINLEDYKKFNMDVIAYSINSSDLNREDSYSVVKEAAFKLKDSSIKLYSKRIDFLIRDNVGSEIDGMLDVLEDRIAIVIPSCPDSGCVTVNGIQLKQGELLKTRSSKVIDIIAAQSKNKCKYIYLEDISKGEKHISNLLKEYSQMSKIIIFDAVLNKDIERIAKAVVLSKLKIVSVDPGPFTMFYAMESLNIKKVSKNILMVVGSVNPITTNQVDNLIEQEEIFLVRVNPKLLMNEKSKQEEIRIAIDKVSHGIEHYKYILLTTIPVGQKKKATKENSTRDISKALGEITKIVLNNNKFCGIFSCGGEVSIEILKSIEAEGVDSLEEVAPLVAYGRIVGGLNPNMQFISKSGEAGEPNILKICIDKIKKMSISK